MRLHEELLQPDVVIYDFSFASGKAENMGWDSRGIPTLEDLAWRSLTAL